MTSMEQVSHACCHFQSTTVYHTVYRFRDLTRCHTLKPKEIDPMCFNRFHGKLCCSVGPFMDLVRASEDKARSRSDLYDISRQCRTGYELLRCTVITKHRAMLEEVGKILALHWITLLPGSVVCFHSCVSDGHTYKQEAWGYTLFTLSSSTLYASISSATNSMSVWLLHYKIQLQQLVLTLEPSILEAQNPFSAISLNMSREYYKSCWLCRRVS